MNNNDATRLDPVIVQRLAQIHPLHLPRLIGQSLYILTSITGLEQSHALFVMLRTTRRWDDLAQLDWQELAEEIAGQTLMSMQACRCAVASIQIPLERAQLHYQLYRTKLASTLSLYTLPATSRQELHQLYQEFERFIQRADKALLAGRTLSDQFQREMLQGAGYSRLRTLLDQMRERYAEYQHMVGAADELQGYMNWYLAWVRRAEYSGEPVAVAA